ncbi:MAG TPA: molybdenum cofactor guanylyltransferase [Frankiaceae bacterium]|nr:molybdenum cofactor guanylyltransferase [Frankiaceae bacterium]
MQPFDAIVLAGGNSRRLGGRDKLLEVVGTRRLIDRVLDAVSAADRIVAVGEKRDGTGAATWVREEPPGGGPVAALAAGLQQVSGALVVLLAGDLPFVQQLHVDRLLEVISAAEPTAAGAMYVDRDGRDQPLLSVWRTGRLRDVLPSDPAGHGLRRVLAPLDVIRLPGGDDLVDCDTPEDLAAARARAGSSEERP